MWEKTSFITLTYNPENLPPRGSLNHRDFQLFMKRLREYLYRIHGINRVAFYMCGEYGENFSRPHYHLILFGFDFTHDRVIQSRKRGNVLYQSETLNKLWGHGFASIGAVTYQSAKYCARYVMKKITGDRAKDHYKRVDTETGEIYKIDPEYQKMSLRPAIGRGFFEAYNEDIYPDDFVVIDGKKVRSPRYYDYLLEKSNPDLLARVKHRRKQHAEKLASDNTRDRRAVKEKNATLAFQNLKRELHS